MRLRLKESGITEADRRIGLMEHSFEGAPKRIAKDGAEAILESLKTFVPKHTGRAASELGYTLINDIVGWRADFYGPQYLEIIISGHGPISAGIFTGRSNKKFLKFEGRGGETIFTRHVRGVLPNDFRIPALSSLQFILLGLMTETGRKVVRGDPLE